MQQQVMPEPENRGYELMPEAERRSNRKRCNGKQEGRQSKRDN